ncbi:hypothetical protein LCL95_12870 [Bacillus timonensis]|nr:hypothetical protein [Bacillus timonensis]
MDKHNSHRISIKINGQERSFKTNNESEEKIEGKNTSLIDHNELAAAKEIEELEEFEWVLPKESKNSKGNKEEFSPIEDVRNLPKPSKLSKNKLKSHGLNRKSNFPYKELIASIVLAVFIGSLFGVVILNLFTRGDEVPVVNPSVPLQGDEKPVKSNDNKENNLAVTLELPHLTSSVIQVGKFSTKESAMTVLNTAKTSNFPAVISNEQGFFYVYVGIGLTKDNLSTISKEYSKVSEEFWAKPIEVSGGTFENVNEKDAQLIKKSKDLFEKMLHISDIGFTSGVISNEIWSPVDQATKELISNESEIKNDDILKLSNTLKSAYTNLLSYKESNEKRALWDAQQTLLNALVQYQLVIDNLAKN